MLRMKLKWKFIIVDAVFPYNVLSLQNKFLGLFGFDSGQERYVSRQCAEGQHYKTIFKNYLATTILLLLLDRSTVDLA